jgi:hypothetical protein
MAQNVVIDPECKEEIERLLTAPSQRLIGLVARWQDDTIEIGFAPGSERVLIELVGLTSDNVAAQPVPVAPRRARRTARVDWYGLGVVLLIITAALAAVTSLLAMVHP